MPVATKNTELVPKQELATLIQYNEELIKSKNNLGEIIPVLHNAALGLEAYTGDYKTLVQMLKSYEKMQADTKKAVDDYGRSISALAAAEKRYAQSLSDEGKQLAIVKEQTRQQNQENRTMAKEVLAADNSLNKLRATLSRLKAEAATLDIDSEEFAKATADIKALNDKILKAEQSMGVHTRNVGNYASAFNGLGFQVQQVARELPALTISASQFFLAISNNLPMLTDELKRAVDENKAFREANKGLAADQQTQVVPVWKQLLKSILSWQTALVVGITLITAYGKEIGAWIKQLFAGRDALEDVRKASDELTTEVSAEIIKMNILLSQLKNAKRESDEYKRAKDELISQYDKYLPNMESEIAKLTDEIDLRNKLATAIYKETTAKKQAEAATKAQEEYLKKATRKVGNRLNESLFSNTFGEEAGAYQEAYVLALIGNEEQQQIARDIEEAIRRYYREAYARANTWNFDKKSKEEQQMLISTSPSDVVDESLADIRRFASEYSTQLDALKQLGEDTAAALGLLYRDSDGNGNNGDEAKTIKTIASLREEISKLQQEIEQVDLSSPDADKKLADLNSQLQVKEKELKVAEQIAGIDNSDDGSSSTTTTRLSEKRQAEIELEKAQAEEAAAIQQSIYEDENRNYAEREIALTNFYARKRELAQIDYDASKEELDARLAAGEIDQATYDAVLASLDFSKGAAFTQLKRDQQEAGRELAQAIADGMMERMGTAAENMAKELDTAMQSEFLALANEYKQGLIDKEEFEKKKAEIADKYRRQQFEKEIGILESELKYFTHSADDRERISKMLAEKQIEYNQYKNDQQIASDTEAGDAAAEIEKSKASLKMQLLDEVFNFASTLNNAWLEKETDRLDKESENNEKWRDDEIASIERLEEQGVISKEQAEARKQQIEDQAAANEEEIEKKRIEAQRQAAIYDKAISAAQAGVAIALAITKSLATPALIPWIAAIGAVQLATILATPIPEYARGTDDHGGGLAIVGDGGRPELVVLPDRTMWRTPSTDTLVNLPEHAQVLPDYYAAVRELAMPRLERADIPTVDVSGIMRKLDQTGDKITETNRLFRVSIARADKRSKNSNFLSNNKPSKLWK